MELGIGMFGTILFIPLFIQALTSQLDLWLDRYQVFFATEKADIEGCLEVLEEVRRKELNRVAGASVLASHALDASKDDYRLAACRDAKSGQIIGCMRVTPATAARYEKASVDEYRLDLVTPEAFSLSSASMIGPAVRRAQSA